MPHAVYTRNLSRSRSLRKATVRSLAQALITHERIETTVARAKETQRLVERLITLGKSQSLASRRHAISLLDDSRLVHRLFTDVAPRFSSRSGGYTRILRTRFRPGDGASLAVIELTELAPRVTEEKKPKTKKEERPEAPKRQPSEKQEPKKTAEQKPAQPQKKKEPESPEKHDEKKGFFGGLRKFFKKDRPRE